VASGYEKKMKTGAEKSQRGNSLDMDTLLAMTS